MHGEHSVSNAAVARCLTGRGHTLQANVKTREGPEHPGRDARRRYRDRQVKPVRHTGGPALSSVTRKKALRESLRNESRKWRPPGNPDEVSACGFPDRAGARAIPYGAYRMARNRAVVNAGVTHEAAEFAAGSIRR